MRLNERLNRKFKLERFIIFLKNGNCFFLSQVLSKANKNSQLNYYEMVTIVKFFLKLKITSIFFI